MSGLTDDLKTHVLGCDPYTGFDWTQYPDDLTGGEIYPIFEEIIKQIKPNFIVEVGSWKGKSAIHMAKLMQKYVDGDKTILCVDTWLGSDVVHQFTHKNDLTWGLRGMSRHGYSTMYYQFLSNVCRAKLEDIIVPFPNTSTVAGRWFAGQDNLTADVVYIDASHEEDECYRDMQYFWPVVRPGGVMFGDDFEASWYPVICAANRFAKEHNLRLMVAHGNKWVLQKPPD